MVSDASRARTHDLPCRGEMRAAALPGLRRVQSGITLKETITLYSRESNSTRFYNCLLYTSDAADE